MTVSAHGVTFGDLSKDRLWFPAAALVEPEQLGSAFGHVVKVHAEQGEDSTAVCARHALCGSYRSRVGALARKVKIALRLLVLRRGRAPVVAMVSGVCLPESLGSASITHRSMLRRFSAAIVPAVAICRHRKSSPIVEWLYMASLTRKATQGGDQHAR
jgi:hypothetical protein